ncbi:hypothetical protein [Rhodoligotrophos appendicifer]|nr:hypothetical protein [Rhodoligotrophos appendicifer]
MARSPVAAEQRRAEMAGTPVRGASAGHDLRIPLGRIVTHDL